MIISRVRRTLLERRLIEPGTCALAACSGGPDSAAMLVALARLQKELGFTLTSASINHGLREAAASEVEIARRQAEQVGVEFHPLEIEVPAGTSVQAEARAARYAALKALAGRIGAGCIATGHTQDDQAETVIMRILRGTGLDGLGGIAPARADGVVRPLIDCRRQEVLRFAQEHCCEIAHDPSNLDPRFERVRIRQEVLPMLQQEDPAIVQHLGDLADDARESTRTICRQAEQLLGQAGREGPCLSQPILRQADRATRRVAVRIWMRERTGVELGRAHLDQIDRAIASKGEIWLPGGWAVTVAEQRITCSRRDWRGGSVP
jgi:tRNA(Ile)-lysidine synthase